MQAVIVLCIRRGALLFDVLPLFCTGHCNGGFYKDIYGGESFVYMQRRNLIYKEIPIGGNR